MTDFFAALSEAFPEYGALLVITALAYFLVARHSTVSWFDPWAAQQVQSIFASASVLFMWRSDIIDTATMLYHVAATLCFFGAASWAFRNTQARGQPSAVTVTAREVSRLRLAIFVVFLVSQTAAWILNGLPILLESRLDAFTSGDGTGLFSRLIAFSSSATVFLTVLTMGLSSEARLRLRDIAVLTAIVAGCVLGGSKGAILLTVLFFLVSDLLCRRLFSPQYRPLHFSRKLVGLSLAVSCLLMLVPIAIEARRSTSEPDGGALEQLVARLVLSGDGYMWFYGDKLLDSVDVRAPAALLFTDVLGMFRVIPRDALPTHPGFSLYRDLNPQSDANRGPNMRMDLFGLLFGSAAAGLAFACISGLTFGFARTVVLRARTLPGVVTGAFLFLNIPLLLVDPVLGVTVVVNAALGFALASILWIALTGRSVTHIAKSRNATAR